MTTKTKERKYGKLKQRQQRRTAIKATTKIHRQRHINLRITHTPRGGRALIYF